MCRDREEIFSEIKSLLLGGLPSGLPPERGVIVAVVSHQAMFKRQQSPIAGELSKLLWELAKQTQLTEECQRHLVSEALLYYETCLPPSFVLAPFQRKDQRGQTVFEIKDLASFEKEQLLGFARSRQMLKVPITQMPSLAGWVEQWLEEYGHDPDIAGLDTKPLVNVSGPPIG